MKAGFMMDEVFEEPVVFFCHPKDAKKIMVDGNDDLMVTFKGMPRGQVVAIPAQEFIDFVCKEGREVYYKER